MQERINSRSACIIQLVDRTCAYRLARMCVILSPKSILRHQSVEALAEIRTSEGFPNGPR